METIRTGGVEIAYARSGTGPALVLAHGAGDDHRVWEPQREALSDVCTVVAWDEPGSGRSSDIPPHFGLSDYAECLAALIDAVGSPAIVGGISWGGTVVIELCRRHPASAAALVLADTYAGWKGSLPPGTLAARVGAAREQLDAPPDGRPLLEGLFAGAPSPQHAALLRLLAAAARPSTLRAQLDAMATADLRDTLPRIAVPTLLVWGDRDARSPLAVARSFERAIADATLVVLERCGHLSNLERPEAFSDAVRAFLAGLAR